MSGASTSGPSIRNKPPGEKWVFTEEELTNTPSRRDKVTPEKELNYRQQAANLIQDMGQRLPVNQLTINTAIVYMHRFYMFHSFQAFSRFAIAPTALFLAAKVEEQPRKLEHVIRVCHSCLHPDKPHLDVHSDNYLKQAQQLVEHELIMLQTMGFDISIDHPHTHVVKYTQLVKASRDLSQMAYFMATNSLHLTTFCLKYKPTVVSAMCIHLSCKWSNYEIPLSSEGKAYWSYMDPTITETLLDNIINEFLKILNLCPTRLRKLKNYRPSSRDGSGGSTPQSKDGQLPKPSPTKVQPAPGRAPQPEVETRRPGSGQHPPSDPQKKPTSSITIAEYKHKREKELMQSKQAPAFSPSSKPGQGNNSQRPPLSRPAYAALGPSNHSAVKTEMQPSKYQEKIHPRAANHKHTERVYHPHGQKLYPQPSSSKPGVQKPKQPVQLPSGQHKEHPKLQQHHQQYHRQPHPPHHAKPPPPKHKELSAVRTKDPQVPESSDIASTTGMVESGDTDDKLLAGMEQKLMEHIKAEKAESGTKDGALPFTKSLDQQTASYNPPLKEHKSRHSMPNLQSRKEPADSPSQAPSPSKTYKILYEQYKKNPEGLRRQLKQKTDQTDPLTNEEKQIWHKLKKDDERQKRKKKHEKHRLNRSQPVEGHGDSERGNATPGSGPLTVRIKLPPSVRAEISKGKPPASGTGAGPPIASSSGSGSEVTLSSPSGSAVKPGRKRTHAQHDTSSGDPVSAKHSKKSEGHHHHSHHSSHDSSRQRHGRHSRSSSHHHYSKSQHAGHKIDDSTFQQALVDAVSMVQSGQTARSSAGTEMIVPTVTLKRTGTQNESDSYIAHSSRQEKSKSSRRSRQHDFDPTVPISNTPPENLFEADERLKSENHSTHNTKNSELSSPEIGEIVDDDDASPFNTEVPEQLSYSQRQHGNSSGKSHRYQQWTPAVGDGEVYTGPPVLTHGANPNAKLDSRKNYDNRLPPMPPLTIKPSRMDQR